MLIPDCHMNCHAETHEDCPSYWSDQYADYECGCVCHDEDRKLSDYLTGRSDVLPHMTPFVFPEGWED